MMLRKQMGSCDPSLVLLSLVKDSEMLTLYVAVAVLLCLLAGLKLH